MIHAQLPDGVLQEMPEQIRAVLAEAREVEFATISARGVPVNNPLFHYYGPAGTTIDVATGVAYPAKADRARRNPRVGLLFAPGIAAQDPVVKGSLPGQVSLEGTAAVPPADQPVVVICATASVRDSDIQANTDRYVRDFLRDHPLRVPWEQDRERVWYYARIYIECTPRRVLFWPAGVSGGAAPVVWEAPPQWRARPSDPAPASRGARREEWPASPWRGSAEAVLADIPIPTLTVIDDDGYPLPFPTTGARITDEGFELSLPGRAALVARRARVPDVRGECDLPRDGAAFRGRDDLHRRPSGRKPSAVRQQIATRHVAAGQEDPARPPDGTTGVAEPADARGPPGRGRAAGDRLPGLNSVKI